MSAGKKIKSAPAKAKSRPARKKKTEELVYVGPLSSYLARLRDLPLLSPDDEHRYAVDLRQTGNPDAALRLVLGNLRLVVKIAMDYRRHVAQLMDLIQEGNIGLMEAVKKFDPYRGVKLSSYSSWWIRAYIIRYLLNNAKLVKIGTTQDQRKLFFNLKKEKARLAARGIEPSTQLIAKNLNVSARTVVEMEQRLENSDVSLDTPVGADGRATIGDLQPADRRLPDETIEEVERRRVVRRLVAEIEPELSDRERFILKYRLLTDSPVTLREVGDNFDLSRERARQIETGLLNKMRDRFAEHGYAKTAILA